MAVSTAPAAKAALLAMLQARPGLAAPVIVSRNMAPPAGDYYEMVIISGVSNTMDAFTFRAGGQGKTKEVYTITIAIDVLRAGTDGADAETRAYELMGEVEEALAADRTIGGTVQFSQRAGYSEEPLWNVQARETRIHMQVKCTALVQEV